TSGAQCGLAVLLALFRLGFSFSLLLYPSTAENVFHGVVAFVAGVLVDGPFRGIEGQLGCPGLSVESVVFHNELIEDLFVIPALKTLDNATVFADANRRLFHLLR